MKSKITTTCLLFLAAAVFAASANTPAIIPLPQKIELHDGVFNLTADTCIYSDSASRDTAKFLTEQLRPATGYPLKSSTNLFGSAAVPGGIFLTTKSANTNHGLEGYELTVASNFIAIRTPTQEGLFYGVQTCFKLLPPEIFSTNLVKDVDWQIPWVQIEDWPRFQ